MIDEYIQELKDLIEKYELERDKFDELPSGDTDEDQAVRYVQEVQTYKAYNRIIEYAQGL